MEYVYLQMILQFCLFNWFSFSSTQTGKRVCKSKHPAGITLQVSPCRYHAAGITLQVSRSRYHAAGITLKTWNCRLHAENIKSQIPHCRYYAAERY